MSLLNTKKQYLYFASMSAAAPMSTPLPGAGPAKPAFVALAHYPKMNMGAHVMTLAKGSQYGHAFEDLPLPEVDNLSLILFMYDSIRAFAIQFADGEHLPRVLWWKLQGIDTGIPLYAVRLGITADTTVHFAYFGTTPQGRRVLSVRGGDIHGHIFMTHSAGGEIKNVKPIRYFLIGTIYRDVIYRKPAGLNPEPFKPITTSIGLDAGLGYMTKASPAAIGHDICDMNGAPRPTAVNITWKPGSTFFSNVHGVDMIHIRDSLAERVLRFMCGGVPRFFTGFLPTARMESRVDARLPSSL